LTQGEVIVNKKLRGSAKGDGTCKAIKEDGSGCRARARESSTFCFFHDMDSQNERKDAQQRGGRANRSTVLPADAPDVSLDSLRDITGLYARIINLQLKGEVSPKEASSLGYNCSQLAKLLETSTIEERLVALEKAQKTRLPQTPLPDPFEDEEDVRGDES
jgi:hypothetical protein